MGHTNEKPAVAGMGTAVPVPAASVSDTGIPVPVVAGTAVSVPVVAVSPLRVVAVSRTAEPGWAWGLARLANPLSYYYLLLENENLRPDSVV